jgi:hypothetical protein
MSHLSAGEIAKIKDVVGVTGESTLFRLQRGFRSTKEMSRIVSVRYGWQERLNRALDPRQNHCIHYRGVQDRKKSRHAPLSWWKSLQQRISCYKQVTVQSFRVSVPRKPPILFAVDSKAEADREDAKDEQYRDNVGPVAFYFTVGMRRISFGFQQTLRCHRTQGTRAN